MNTLNVQKNSFESIQLIYCNTSVVSTIRDTSLKHSTNNKLIGKQIHYHRVQKSRLYKLI